MHRVLIACYLFFYKKKTSTRARWLLRAFFGDVWAGRECICLPTYLFSPYLIIILEGQYPGDPDRARGGWEACTQHRKRNEEKGQARLGRRIQRRVSSIEMDEPDGLRRRDGRGMNDVWEERRQACTWATILHNATWNQRHILPFGWRPNSEKADAWR